MSIEIELKAITCRDCKKTMMKESTSGNTLIYICGNCKTMISIDVKMIKDAASKAKRHPKTITDFSDKRSGSNIHQIITIKEEK